MERKSPIDIIPSIINSLKEGEQTINQLSKKSKINRVTLSQYISAFEKTGLIKTRRDGRERYVQLRNNPDSYFDLPINEKDKKTMQTIYALIKKACIKLYNKEPGKTHVYKIINDINVEQNLNLPIGWYQYGPCSVLIYRGNEEQQIKLNFKIKEKVKEYCKLEKTDLQQQIYKKYKKELYQFKERVLKEKNPDIIKLITLVQKEAIETTTDFVRATLLLGWKNTIEIFKDSFWKYIALIEFKESLRDYYGEDIDKYLELQIKDLKDETAEKINEKILEFTDSKHSQDKLYQRWVKQKK
ncbi:MAG: helix-turn-helix domain-containing protein [Candidatus Woesearchaeota archaeon]